ncbi:extracellular solute-binding protein [Yoonia sp. F2084L]|uniref:ABC transporter substrate-binding protein n=1 Tax=Yoonia sp. F2084L TaxID=2926419 RepID=UPI001FF3E461|nr:extracellular solute-binding protein [Yoonia sp. F2084L]MCK0096743.1 extracellular solute-binding protein [Yoonia sp. F2084L]
MDVIDQLNAVKTGKLSRRAFQKTLLGAGIGIMTTPFAASRAAAQDAQGTLFTWGGFDIPDLYTSYEAANGAPPDFAVFGGAEDALTRMRSGFVVDVAHPCHTDMVRWVQTGLFQPIDTSRLSNWGDVLPELVALESNEAENGMPWMVPFDWGGTSITYRTDLVEIEGEESWDILWDERYAGRIGMLASGGDAWWCAAIKAGVPFDQIATEMAFEKTSAALREQRPLVRVYTDDTTTLGQALSSGEMVAAMTWNSTAVELQAEEIPVRFAQPKEGALTWVCGLMMHKDAPNPDRAYDIIDSMLSVEAGEFMIGAYGYGHSNAKSFESFTDDELQGLGLSANPREILDAGQFSIPQEQEWESRMNETYELIKAGF